MKLQELFSSPFIQALLIVVIAIVLIAGFFIAFNIGSLLGSEKKQVDTTVKTEEKPSILIIYLTSSPCSECFDLNAFVESFRQMDAVVSIKSIEFSSDEAKALIQKYSIARIPSIVISGETSKVPQLIESWKTYGSVEDNNVLVLKNTPPVYFDLTSNKLVGLVELISLTIDSCIDCAKPITEEELASVGVTVSKKTTVDYSSPEGKALVDLYTITQLPSSILSRDLNTYPQELVQNFLLLGSFASDGKYVLRKASPIFFDLTSQKEVGWVNLTNLTDSSCSSCYDVSTHKPIIEQQFGVKIKEEKAIDINSSEGKALLADYNITKVPTILLTGDMQVYDAFNQAWSSVGSIEADDTYIFRQVESMGTYFDLDQNKLVEVAVDENQ